MTGVLMPWAGDLKPGDDRAHLSGSCRCDPLENRHGAGALVIASLPPEYWIADRCPSHGARARVGHRKAQQTRQRLARVAATILFVLFVLCLPVLASAQSLGILGDSDSDEYRGTDNRCKQTPYAATTKNWVELYADAHPGALGVWANWGGIRRLGYAQNWARSGATSAQVLSQGQHTGLAAQGVDLAILHVGVNDLKPGKSLYEGIYSGSQSASSVAKALTAIVTAQRTAITTVMASGAAGYVMTMLAHAPDAAHQDPVGLARIAQAVATVNAGLVAASVTYGFTIIPYADMGLWLQASGYLQVDGTLLVGGETITASASCEPHSALLNDGHMGTVLNGLLLNLALDVTGLAPALTDPEILTAAGL